MGNIAGTPGFDPERRRFLSTAAAATGVILAPGVFLYGVAASRPAAAQELNASALASARWGMLIDINRCHSGCEKCVSACVEENGLQGHGRPATDAQWIRKVERAPGGDDSSDSKGRSR